MAMRPTITCRTSWPVLSFTVDTAGLPLYMVELAAAPRLMVDLACRTPDNYFCGGDHEHGFATGPLWSVPAPVWARLSRLRLVYYRVLAVDCMLAEPVVSVDDDSIDSVPAVRVAGDPWCGATPRPGSGPGRRGSG